jgi:hypothetical protein
MIRLACSHYYCYNHYYGGYYAHLSSTEVMMPFRLGARLADKLSPTDRLGKSRGSRHEPHRTRTHVEAYRIRSSRRESACPRTHHSVVAAVRGSGRDPVVHSSDTRYQCLMSNSCLFLLSSCIVLRLCGWETPTRQHQRLLGPRSAHKIALSHVYTCLNPDCPPSRTSTYLFTLPEAVNLFGRHVLKKVALYYHTSRRELRLRMGGIFSLMVFQKQSSLFSRSHEGSATSSLARRPWSPTFETGLLLPAGWISNF